MGALGSPARAGVAPSECVGTQMELQNHARGPPTGVTGQRNSIKVNGPFLIDV